MREIQLRDAKAKLSAVVDEAIGGQGAIITRHGRRDAVVISYAEFVRLSNIPSFAELLTSSPLGEEDLPARRPARSVDLG